MGHRLLKRREAEASRTRRVLIGLEARRLSRPTRGWYAVYFFAADSPALDPATASAFVESANADAFRILGSAAGGAILIVVGGLVLSVGLWRSGNVPKWLIVLSVIGSIITFFLPTTGIVGVFVESPQAFSGAMLGWYAWRRRHAGAEAAPSAA